MVTRSLEHRVARLERSGDPVLPAGTVWGPTLHAPLRSLEVLATACTGHADGGTSADPTVGACWDADRLNLWWVGGRQHADRATAGLARQQVRLPVNFSHLMSVHRPVRTHGPSSKINEVVDAHRALPRNLGKVSVAVCSRFNVQGF